MRTQDGAQLYDPNLGAEWTWEEGQDDDGRRWGVWTCGRCGGTATGDRTRADHVCRTTCSACDRPMVFEHDEQGGRWVVADRGWGCEGTDNAEHDPELP